MTTTAAGLLTICITDTPTEDVIAQASERFDILRAPTMNSLMNSLEMAIEHSESTHILIEGLLDALYDPRMQTRDAARALGRVKARLESLAESGVEVVVLCRALKSDLGTRSHFLPSLCVAADRVITNLLAA